jgi:hypothetical protein
MIISIWKPTYSKGKIDYYSLVGDHPSLLSDMKGKTAYKVIWVCDSEKCKNPDKTHSINASHLTKKKMSIETQICRPCQCSGEGNGRYGDNRTWEELLGKKRSEDLKIEYSEKWNGNNNPSHRDNVKVKKNQTIINEKTLPKIIEDIGFSLVEINELIGKNSILTIRCNQGHIVKKKYVNIVRKGQKYICEKCFYKDISLNLTDEELNDIINYKRQVRALTAKTYKEYRSVINPDNLPIGRGKYHIDHKYSLHEGYKNNVGVKVISSKENLQILSEYENLSKQQKCDIELNDLIEKTLYLYNK